MTSHVGRIYATAITLFVFFLTWALVAARPFPSSSRSSADPRLQALAVREQRLRQESVVVRRIVARRWTTYRAQLAKRQSQIAAAKRAQLAAAAAPAAAPSVRVVSLPPVTVTRTS
jgi:hypothetical protein